MTAQEFLDRLAAYREMFWPDFVEHDDCFWHLIRSITLSGSKSVEAIRRASKP
jgi:hypothetical protein